MRITDNEGMWQTGYQGWTREASHGRRARAAARGHSLGDAQSGAILTQRQPVSLAAGVAGQGHVLPVAAVMGSPLPPGTLKEAGFPSRAADVVQPHGPCGLLKVVCGGLPAVPADETHTLRRAAASGVQEPQQPQHRNQPQP